MWDCLPSLAAFGLVASQAACLVCCVAGCWFTSSGVVCSCWQPIILELAIANESEGGGTIVVLAEDPKEEMELRIQEVRVPSLSLAAAYFVLARFAMAAASCRSCLSRCCARI